MSDEIKLNKKKIRNINELKIRLIAGALTLIFIPSYIFALSKFSDNDKKSEEEIIVEYFGEGSEEDLVLDYIDISKKLNDLKLYKYNIDESLLTTYNISNELKTPKELKVLIEKFESIDNSVSYDDLKTQSDNINLILNLVRQESLVNSYIYTIGYSVAHTNITTATKEYAGEVFGIDEGNIKFRYYPNNSIVSVDNIERTKYGYDEKETYSFGDSFLSSEERTIKDGVVWMEKVDDGKKTTSALYDEDRNDIIIDALKKSVDLYQEVIEEDLYDSDLAGKLRK